MTQHSIRDSARPREAAGDPVVAIAPEEPTDPIEPKPLKGPRAPIKERLKHLSPGVVILTIAAVASLGFLLYELSTRTASVPLLTSAALVAGMVYVVVAIACSVATYRMGSEGRLGPALVLALVGGIAAIGSAVAFAGALVLFLALGF